MLDPRKLWSPVEVRTEIAAAPTTVFDVLADPRTYPEWLVGAKKIRGVDADFPRAGAEFDHTVGAGPVSVDDSTEVVAVHRPDRLELKVKVGPFEGHVELLVLASPKGSEVRFRERPIGAPAALTPVLRPTIQARNGESLRQLRELIETNSEVVAEAEDHAKDDPGATGTKKASSR